MLDPNAINPEVLEFLMGIITGVIERFGENNGDLVAESLVQQLLKVATKDQALKLIRQHGYDHS